ncbi:MAG: homocysteine biosynthesis protein, partial [Candidatus Micrarchaeota archaeon]
TQHDPKSGMGTMMVKGDLKGMSQKYLRGASVLRYGTSMFVGVGIPIPILNAGLAKKTGIQDSEITINVFDYGIVGKYRPPLKKATYAELKTGKIEIEGRTVRASSLSSYHMAREVANALKEWIKKGKFLLSTPAERLPTERAFKRMKHAIPMVGNFMKDALKLKPDDSVKSAAKLLVEGRREHALVVNEAKEPVGMITAWEIARAVLTEKTKVSEIMTKDLITAKKEESIETAVRRMEYHGVSALPVLDEAGKLVGVVTLKYLTNLIR